MAKKSKKGHSGDGDIRSYFPPTGDKNPGMTVHDDGENMINRIQRSNESQSFLDPEPMEKRRKTSNGNQAIDLTHTEVVAHDMTMEMTPLCDAVATVEEEQKKENMTLNIAYRKDGPTEEVDAVVTPDAVALDAPIKGMFSFVHLSLPAWLLTAVVGMYFLNICRQRMVGIF